MTLTAVQVIFQQNTYIVDAKQTYLDVRCFGPVDESCVNAWKHHRQHNRLNRQLDNATCTAKTQINTDTPSCRLVWFMSR